MKGLKINLLKGSILMIALNSFTTFGQPSFGIMEFSNNVDNLYWWHANVASDLQDLLSQEFQTLGTAHELTREHVLLLLKEVEPPDFDNLPEDVIKEIGRNEQLKYMVTSQLMSVEIKDVVVTFIIRLVIYKTDDGTIVWQDAPKIVKELKAKEINDKVLVEQALKPALLDMIGEIKKLKWK